MKRYQLILCIMLAGRAFAMAPDAPAQGAAAPVAGSAQAGPAQAGPAQAARPVIMCAFCNQPITERSAEELICCHRYAHRLCLANWAWMFDACPFCKSEHCCIPTDVCPCTDDELYGVRQSFGHMIYLIGSLIQKDEQKCLQQIVNWMTSTKKFRWALLPPNADDEQKKRAQEESGQKLGVFLTLVHAHLSSWWGSVSGADAAAQLEAVKARAEQLGGRVIRLPYGQGDVHASNGCTMIDLYAAFHLLRIAPEQINEQVLDRLVRGGAGSYRAMVGQEDPFLAADEAAVAFQDLVQVGQQLTVLPQEQWQTLGEEQRALAVNFSTLIQTLQHIGQQEHVAIAAVYTRVPFSFLLCCIGDRWVLFDSHNLSTAFVFSTAQAMQEFLGTYPHFALVHGHGAVATNQAALTVYRLRDAAMPPTPEMVQAIASKEPVAPPAPPPGVAPEPQPEADDAFAEEHVAAPQPRRRTQKLTPGHCWRILKQQSTCQSLLSAGLMSFPDLVAHWALSKGGLWSAAAVAYHVGQLSYAWDRFFDEPLEQSAHEHVLLKTRCALTALSIFNGGLAPWRDLSPEQAVGIAGAFCGGLLLGGMNYILMRSAYGNPSLPIATGLVHSTLGGHQVWRLIHC